MNLKKRDYEESKSNLDSMTDLNDGLDLDGISSRGSDGNASARSRGLSTGTETAKMLLQKELEEGPATILKTLKEIPGVCLFPFWLAMYACVCVITRKLSKRASCQGKTATLFTSDEYAEMQQFWTLGAACFGVVVMVQTANIIFQISAKKRILGSLVFFINAVACSTYVAQARGWIVPVIDSKGREVQIARYLEWMSTTVMMLLTIHAVGNSMSSKLVRSWRQTLKVLALDEAMLILGLLHSIYYSIPVVGTLLELFSCICLLLVFQGVNRVVNESVARAATTYEINSMKAIGYMTYVQWTLMAIPHMLYTRGFVSWLVFEQMSTGLDLITKTVYAVTLLTGNFCILDVVQTLRVAQLKAENRLKSSSVVRVDVMNQALHTAALEAEAESRLSRRFLANVSHELRTPLNSVIAFNTLVMEDSSAQDAHQEYCASALTAAESLLGIINQVLDYTQMDNEIQLTSHLQLENALFSITDVMDELADIVSARVNEKKVDFAIETADSLYGNTSGADPEYIFMGDGFRLRQAITALCDNATKFCKDVGGQVVVRVSIAKSRPKATFGAVAVTEGEDEGARSASPARRTVTLVIDVTDNGIGIDPEKHFLLFKPFSQVHSGMSRKAHGGLGLGLAITKSIVDAMGGTVKCISEGEDLGATFRMEVPFEIGVRESPEQFPSYPPLPRADQVCLRLIMSTGPSTTAVAHMLARWGVRPENTIEMNFDALIPPEATLARVIARMRTDAEAAAAGPCPPVVYLVESAVLVALMVDGSCASECGELLSNLFGIVFGHIDEQALLRRGLGDVGATASGLSRWQTMTKPWKCKTLYRKVAELINKEKVDPDSALAPSEKPKPKWSCSPAMRSSMKMNVSAPEASQAPPKEALAENMRILLVDDHSVNQKVALRMIQKVLGAANVTVHIASDGFEAISMVKKSVPELGSYHLILMDVQMPGCDGLEATRKIREFETATPTMNPHFICALTAHANKSDVDHCMESGMDKYMSKPVNLEDFRELLLVETHLHVSSAWT